MSKKQRTTLSKDMPEKSVLLIPEPENENDPHPYRIKPGYYDPKQLLQLIALYKSNSEAVRFIADMLETGDPENDGFAVTLRRNCGDPSAIEQIIRACEVP